MRRQSTKVTSRLTDRRNVEHSMRWYATVDGPDGHSYGFGPTREAAEVKALADHEAQVAWKAEVAASRQEREIT